MMHWLAMGGYARFVWPCYGIAFAVVFLNIWWARRAAQAARMQARRRLAMAAGTGTQAADSGGGAA